MKIVKNNRSRKKRISGMIKIIIICILVIAIVGGSFSFRKDATQTTIELTTNGLSQIIKAAGEFIVIVCDK